jgi:hypothetical protein
MATAPQTYTPDAIRLPSGRGDDKRKFISSNYQQSVQLVEETDLTNENGQIAYELLDTVPLPLGTKGIFTQNRMCGDYYCEIDGKRLVAATGDTLNDAFRAAVKLAA